MRPGPEYVLRQYRFFDGGPFDLRLFHYVDSSCQNATHVVVARGRYEHYQTSWIVPGAAETDYELSRVSIVPYASEVVAELNRKLTSGGNGNDSARAAVSMAACRKAFQSNTWQTFQRRDVYNYVDVDYSDHKGLDSRAIPVTAIVPDTYPYSY